MGRTVGLVVVGVVLLTGCAKTFPGTRVEFASIGGSSSAGAVDCDPTASTLADLIEISDKVVVATVVAEHPQFDEAYAGSDVSEQATSPLVRTGGYLNRDLTLEVEQVVSDRGQLPLGTVEVSGWQMLGGSEIWTSFDFNNNHRLEVGDRAVFPLIAVPGESTHGVACTGVFLLEDGEVVPKESDLPRLLEFGTEGPAGTSAYEMSEQELLDTLAGLAP